MNDGFYTSVSRSMNLILASGFTEDGQRFMRKIKFSPTLYYRNKVGTSRALDGTKLSPKVYDKMSDATADIKENSDIDELVPYGNTNYVFQYIAETWPDELKYNSLLIDIMTIDIEVDNDPETGFPDPVKALDPINLITIHSSSSNKFIVLGLEEYTGTYTDFQFIRCNDERALLHKFLTLFNSSNHPHVITGWNTRLFDIPYLFNRISKVLGESLANKISPWGKVEIKDIVIKGKAYQTYNIIGLQQLDFFDLFKKFGMLTFGEQENYKLDTVANTVLGEGKIDYNEYGSLYKLSRANYNLFVEYGFIDTLRVVQMEKRVKYVDLAIKIAYMAGVNYIDTLGTTSVWDTYIYRELNKKGIQLPPKKKSFHTQFEGGYVKEPQVGMHDWVVSFDLASLYPNTMVQYNISPETLIEMDSKNNRVSDFLNGISKNTNNDSILTANGARFSKKTQGIIPYIIENLYEKRVKVKGEMLTLKKELETVKSEIAKRKL